VPLEQVTDLDLIEPVGVVELANQATLLDQEQSPLAVSQVHLGLHLGRAELDHLHLHRPQTQTPGRGLTGKAVNQYENLALLGSHQRAELPLAPPRRDHGQHRAFRDLAQTTQREVEVGGIEVSDVHGCPPPVAHPRRRSSAPVPLTRHRGSQPPS